MNRFEKILLTVFFIELFVGGGGRLIDFGFLSIRQVLFILLILTFMVRIIKQRAVLDKQVNTFIRINPMTIGIYLLLASFIFSSVIGFINHHSLNIIIMDFFRVSFIAAYFPLAYYISDDRFSKERVVQLLRYGAPVVAIFTITVSLLGKTVFASDFGPYYNFMNTIMNDDLFFRPSNSVFYKSHLFVLFGLIVSLNAVLDKKFTKLDVFNIIVCSISVLWSETRGFLLAFVVSILTILLLDSRVISQPVKSFKEKIRTIVASKQFMKKLIISMVVVVSIPFLFNYMTLERFDTPSYSSDSHNKKHKKEVEDVSMNSRVDDIKTGMKILSDPVHFIIGTGYGTDIGGRDTGIEMSFLDIWIEQGIVGLAIWLFLSALVFYNYHLVYKQRKKISTTEAALIASFMGMLLLTNINPFINNPIGITFFLFVLIVSQNRKEKELNGALK